MITIIVDTIYYLLVYYDGNNNNNNIGKYLLSILISFKSNRNVFLLKLTSYTPNFHMQYAFLNAF